MGNPPRIKGSKNQPQPGDATQLTPPSQGLGAALARVVIPARSVVRIARQEPVRRPQLRPGGAGRNPFPKLLLSSQRTPTAIPPSFSAVQTALQREASFYNSNGGGRRGRARAFQIFFRRAVGKRGGRGLTGTPGRGDAVLCRVLCRGLRTAARGRPKVSRVRGDLRSAVGQGQETLPQRVDGNNRPG